jgi:Lar family restriction alleviation protein
MSDDLKELKPCPFCGSEDVKLAAHPGAGIGYLHHSDTVYSIDCLGCTASFASRYKRELLVEQWNRRAPSAELEQAKADAQAVAPSNRFTAEQIAKIQKTLLDAGFKRMNGTTPADAQAVAVQPEFFAVLSPNGEEGVIFKSEDDANYTATGKSEKTKSWGTPTIGDALRYAYANHTDGKLQMIRVSSVAPMAKQNQYELSTEQISAAFENTSFGTNDYRTLLAEGVLKRIAGYHCGHTLTQIMMELGLTTSQNSATKRGKRFCCEHFYRRMRKEGGTQ